MAVAAPMQYDAAVDPSIAATKVKGHTEVAGQANVLVFPNLNSGNVAYKVCRNDFVRRCCPACGRTHTSWHERVTQGVCSSTTARLLCCDWGLGRCCPGWGGRVPPNPLPAPGHHHVALHPLAATGVWVCGNAGSAAELRRNCHGAYHAGAAPHSSCFALVSVDGRAMCCSSASAQRELDSWAKLCSS